MACWHWILYTEPLTSAAECCINSLPSGKLLEFANWQMAIEIVDLHIKHYKTMVIFHSYVNVYQRVASASWCSVGSDSGHYIHLTCEAVEHLFFKCQRSAFRRRERPAWPWPELFFRQGRRVPRICWFVMIRHIFLNAQITSSSERSHYIGVSWDPKIIKIMPANVFYPLIPLVLGSLILRNSHISPERTFRQLQANPNCHDRLQKGFCLLEAIDSWRWWS